MIKHICSDCGDQFHTEESFMAHNCDVPTNEDDLGNETCSACGNSAPCPNHQPVAYDAAEARRRRDEQHADFGVRT